MLGGLTLTAKEGAVEVVALKPWLLLCKRVQNGKLQNNLIANRFLNTRCFIVIKQAPKTPFGLVAVSQKNCYIYSLL